jgi:RsmE family RNA methyltransferase
LSRPEERRDNWTMNIVLFEKSEITRGSVLLEGDRARHIVKILRSVPGDTIKVGEIGGNSGKGVITELSRRPPYRVLLKIFLTEKVFPKPEIDIMLALPRPIMLKRIFYQATELGVGSLFIVNAKRVEKSFWDSNLIDSVNYRQHLLKGMEQAIDTRIPEVLFFRGFKPFMDREFSVLKKHYKHLLIAHPFCPSTLSERIQEPGGRVLLAVGPEGGWIDYEIERMTDAGFKAFSIGNRILRVDTAVVALHSMVSLCIQRN